MGKPFTLDIREAIVAEYFKYRPVTEIARMFNICVQSIHLNVKMMGFKPRHVTIRALSWEQRAEIKRLYDAGMNTHKLAKQFEVSVPSIAYVLKIRKAVMRESAFRKRFACNEKAFDSLTDEAAYWIGFLMADGHVRIGRPPILSLHLATIDIEHVRKFKTFLQAGHKLQIRRASIKFDVRSYPLITSLAYYGMGFDGIRNPAPELCYNRHFWRGVIDGDGSIGVAKRKCGAVVPIMSLIGNESIIMNWLRFVDSIHPINRHPSRIKTCIKPTFHVNITYRVAHAIINELYRDCEVFLDRKKAIADQFVGKPYPLLSGTRRPILAI